MLPLQFPAHSHTLCARRRCEGVRPPSRRSVSEGGRGEAPDKQMTDEEREDVLQLLANYENMSRAIATFIQRVRTDPNIHVRTDRYRKLLEDLEQVVPIWKRYAASVRLKLMMERRETNTPSPESGERRRGGNEY